MSYRQKTGNIITQSKMKDFAKCPLGFYKYYISKEIPEQTETSAMRMGTAFHCMVLEPEKFQEEYFIVPNLRTKQDYVDALCSIGCEATASYKLDELKEIWEQAKAKETRTAISQGEYETMMTASKQAELVIGKEQEQHPGIQKEQHIEINSGYSYKIGGQPDFVDDRDRVVIDIKFVADIEKFDRDLKYGDPYGYTLQLAFYGLIKEVQTGTEYDGMLAVFDKKGRYFVYKISDETMRARMDELGQLASDLEHCFENDVWPARSQEARYYFGTKFEGYIGDNHSFEPVDISERLREKQSFYIPVTHL